MVPLVTVVASNPQDIPSRRESAGDQVTGGILLIWTRVFYQGGLDIFPKTGRMPLLSEFCCIRAKLLCILKVKLKLKLVGITWLRTIQLKLKLVGFTFIYPAYLTAVVIVHHTLLYIIPVKGF